MKNEENNKKEIKIKITDIQIQHDDSNDEDISKIMPSDSLGKNLTENEL
jgi:hypothetical protein